MVVRASSAARRPWTVIGDNVETGDRVLEMSFGTVWMMVRRHEVGMLIRMSPSW